MKKRYLLTCSAAVPRFDQGEHDFGHRFGLRGPQNCSPMATTQLLNLPKKMPPLYLMNTKWFDAPNSHEQKKNRQFASSLGSTCYIHSSPCFITQKCACVRWVIANLILSWFTEAIFTLKKLWKTWKSMPQKACTKKMTWYFTKVRNRTTFRPVSAITKAIFVKFKLWEIRF